MPAIVSPGGPAPRPFHVARHRDPEAASLALAAMDERRDAELAKADRRHALYHLAGRFLVAGMLITSGVVKGVYFATITDWMSELGFLDAGFPLALAVGLEVGAGAMLAFGLWTRRVAAVMLAYLVALSLVMLTWFPPDAARGATLGNAGLAAGLLLLLSHGAGKASLDARRETKALG